MKNDNLCPKEMLSTYKVVVDIHCLKQCKFTEFYWYFLDFFSLIFEMQ